jgi:hypothetical protein
MAEILQLSRQWPEWNRQFDPYPILIHFYASTVLGATSPPATMTPEPFDAGPGHLKRLVLLEGDESGSARSRIRSIWSWV